MPSDFVKSIPLTLNGTGADLKRIPVSQEDYYSSVGGDLDIDQYPQSSFNEYIGRISTVGSVNDSAVGSYTDTFYNQPIGTHPGSSLSIGSTTTTLYQTTTGGLSSPNAQYIVGMDSSGDIFEMSSDIWASYGARLLEENLTNEYRGNFRIGSSSPGTSWETYEAGIFSNTLTNGNTTYNLYRKNSDTGEVSSAPTNYVIKLLGPADKDLEECSFTQAQLAAGYAMRAAREVTGLGDYLLLPSSQTPASIGKTGTWQNRGVAVDTRNTTQNIQYTTVQYTSPQYSTQYTRTYSLQYTGNSFTVVPGTFSGVRSLQFAGTRSSSQQFSGSRVAAFDFGGSRNFAAAYSGTRNFAAQYSGVRTTVGILFAGVRNFANNFGGSRNYASDFGGSRNFAGNYDGSRNFAAQYSGARNFAGNFGGSRNFAAAYSGTRNFAAQYAGTRPGAQNFAGSRNFAGQYSGARGTIVGYIGTRTFDNPGNFTGPRPANFLSYITITEQFAGFAAFEGTREFTGERDFVGVRQVNFAGSRPGITNFEGQRIDFYEGGNDPNEPQFFVKYSSGQFQRFVTFANNFLGPTPQTFSFYTGFASAPAQFTSPAQYEGNKAQTLTFAGVRDAQFSGFRTQVVGPTNFNGVIFLPNNFGGSRNFAAQYLGTRNFANNFGGSRNFAAQYAGSRNFAAQYAGVRTSFGLLFAGSRNFAAAYSGTRNFAAQYAGTRNFAAQYAGVRPQSIQFSGSRNFAGNFGGSRNFAGNYDGSRNFAAQYAGTRNFTNNYLGVRVFPGNFQGNVSGNFAGTRPITYTNQYTGQYSSQYTSNYTSQYSNQFTGETLVAIAETIETYTLYCRVSEV